MRQLPIYIVICLSIFSCSKDAIDKGDKLFESGDFESAILHYNSYLTSNPANVKILYNRGRAYEELKEYAKAEEDFRAVLKLDEKNASAYVSMSKIHYEQNKFENAILYGEKAIKLNSSSPQAYFFTARAKHQLGYADQANEYYTLAIKLNKNYGLAYLYRGAVRMSLNQNSLACEDLRKAKNLDVADAQAAVQKYCN